MGLVYVEFKQRLAGTQLHLFHAVQKSQGSDWSDAYPEDIQLLNIGRTWRLGPEPSYLTIFYTPNSGLERITDWERTFTSGEVQFLEAAGKLCSRVERAGCYINLLDPVPGQEGPYYVEYFDVPDGIERADLSKFFDNRRERNDDCTLHLAADRIGRLGPGPRGLAVWGLADYASLEKIATELDDVKAPVQLIDAGVYANIGDELL